MYLDNLTSNLSTFPYTAAQCQNFLELFKMSRGKHFTCQKKTEHALTLPLVLDYIHDGHVVAYVGQNLHPTTVGNICLTFFFYRSDRTHLVYHMLVPSAFTCLLILTTASTLGYNRYETHYGQDQSRLSRDCAILSDDSTEVQWTRRLLSLLSFRTSNRYLETLDALFVDKFVYAHVWNTFMTTCLKTWRRDCCTSAMFLLFVHLFTQLIPPSRYPDFNPSDCIFYASSILYRQY